MPVNLNFGLTSDYKYWNYLVRIYANLKDLGSPQLNEAVSTQ